VTFYTREYVVSIREPVYDRLAFVRQSAQEVCLVYIRTATLETCSTATGVVVVIDVWCSFTTAPFAFATGARDVVPIASVVEALVQAFGKVARPRGTF
jgi:hypothetical protein